MSQEKLVEGVGSEVSGGGASGVDVGGGAPGGVSGGGAPGGVSGGVATGGVASGGVGGGGVGGSPGGSPGGGVEPTIRDILATLGYQDAARSSSDLEALRSVVGAAARANEYNHHVNDYIANAGAYRQWLQERQAMASQQEQMRRQIESNWWRAPEYDPSWQQKIYRDQSGNLQVIPGSDPSIINKYNAWVEHQQRFLNNLSSDPIGTIRPGIEQLVQEVASNVFQRQMQQIQEQTIASEFIRSNSEWLHARDASGNIYIDPRTQRPALSGLGQQFASYVREAEQMGLNDSNSQQRYAMNSLQRDYLLSKYQNQAGSGNAVDNANDIKQNYLQQQQQQVVSPGVGGSVGSTNGTYQSGSGNPMRILQEMMARDLTSNGLNPGMTILS